MATKKDPLDYLSITPLGAGQEVGRSCLILEYKGKKIMLDCGIHPGHHGFESLPYIEHVDPETIDLLLITHFHLDHCGALPYLLGKTLFNGRTFMTHATKSIYKLLLSDYLKVSNISSDDVLFSESDLENSMSKIETINFHQVVEVNGIKFWAYHAGHVLGAAMFMIEIAGVKILYTGDFSRQEDRHLMSAEIPNVQPNVLICEATYGTYLHEDRDERETRFTTTVHDIISRGGRCLIPVFALGRAQELLLILDEYWSSHPELQDFPIYYASALAKKCIPVYQTFVNAMNERFRRQLAISNPFSFKYISNLKSIDHFDDVGPSVVLASPGMMQNGISRELFEIWCTDSKNGVVIAGYSVEGTMARLLLTHPEEIVALNGAKLPLKCTIDSISFSAHADYRQTSGFIRSLQPPHIIFVHGEQKVMARLNQAIEREYEMNQHYRPNRYMPKNSQRVELFFPGEKMAKVMGELAVKLPPKGERLSGILVKRNWNYHLLSPHDLQTYTSLSTTKLTQRVSVPFTRSFNTLQTALFQLSGDVKRMQGTEKKYCVKVFKNITVTQEDIVCIVEWESSVTNDMYADAVISVLVKTENLRDEPKAKVAKPPELDFCEQVIQLLIDMFGECRVTTISDGSQVQVQLANKQAIVDLSSNAVSGDDDHLVETIELAIKRLDDTVRPVISLI